MIRADLLSQHTRGSRRRLKLIQLLLDFLRADSSVRNHMFINESINRSDLWSQAAPDGAFTPMALCNYKQVVATKRQST